ncbi:Kinesin-like protein [Reticulomyxa filosa]|uniref:Kinesin-like protein n=1 Tax=Reticulomyxa filosa TaxID=46433 RepID=X6N0N1_RETFI|nr:Kinesin-like protein [Reticulomyxa filosa]|eukprot:ETO19830.1 Kinesin-like protein [Reticulomyxa filosa]
MSTSSEDCVQVALRVAKISLLYLVRPLIPHEIARGEDEVVAYPNGLKQQIQIGGDKSYTFDFVFDQKVSQKNIYDTAVRPLVNSFLEGYNATIIAYGQTVGKNKKKKKLSLLELF